jgi:hypothetical protein
MYTLLLSQEDWAQATIKTLTFQKVCL